MRLGQGYIKTLLRVMLYSYLGKKEKEKERSNSRIVIFITYNN
jgi:hypothetical protein